jgi:phosphatidylcholine synthase
VTVAAWLVHLYTASGFVWALLAAQAAIDYDYVWAFLYLWLQVAVDATDGVLARWADVSRRVPWFSGSKLDDLVDYLAYAFVPALIVWRGLFVPGEWATPLAAAMLVASGYGFSRLDAKTSDHYFTGFPSYWNIVVLYFFLTRSQPWVNAWV